MRSLKNEINVSDLIRMKEEGMSNRQIANMLQIGVATVSRYLNKNKVKVRGNDNDNIHEAKWISIKNPQLKKIEQERFEKEESYKMHRAEPKRLEKISNIMELKGAMCDFKVDIMTGEILLHNGVIEGVATKESLEELIADLCDLRMLFA